MVRRPRPVALTLAVASAGAPESRHGGRHQRWPCRDRRPASSPRRGRR